MSSSLSDVLASMQLDRHGAASFVGTQLPAPANHILGGHVSAQAPLAASLTAPGRTACTRTSCARVTHDSRSPSR